ncbi:HNH endonuclease [Aliarcobacter cryaerophilus]|uniref:HNH endonuclease n=1 Tax=Aliarcobacter cryaerophilus TaxID=28198 RepID=UPI003DA5C044
MKKEDIKKHLSIYSIYNKRKTTINHAFASSIAPIDLYNDTKIREALLFLEQDPDSLLKCVYCENEAQTWDHLVGLVKNNELRGFGHQIGNLVPCCKECNSKKGSKDYQIFIQEHNKIKKNKEYLINILSSYQEKYTTKLDFEKLKLSQEYKDFILIKEEIFKLIEKADLYAKKIRDEVLI